MHADGAGTKSSLAYMYWKETGDVSVWKGIAQDALIMNIDDLLCVGATDNIMLSSTIGRNKNLIPGEVISAIINGTEELIAELKTLESPSIPQAAKQPMWAIWCVPSS
jgi:phosphoribosylformylglycinamidine cyclo-ligase